MIWISSQSNGVELMIPQKQESVDTLKDLFDFYHNTVKPLYSYVQADNVLPFETLFEINAALDHISRHWAQGETEAQVVKQAFGHFKRSCLDLFKIRLRETGKHYQELKKIDTSVIDNGEFDRKLNVLYSEIRKSSGEARRRESELDATNKVPAFGLWEGVFAKCEELERDFYLNPRVSWAKRRGFFAFIRDHTLSFLLGVISSILATLILGGLTLLINQYFNK